jgi:hypothetical protein
MQFTEAKQLLVGSGARRELTQAYVEETALKLPE